MLVRYGAGESVSKIAREMEIDRPTVDRTIAKALAIGAVAALDDLPGRGRPKEIPAEARAWVVSVACQKPVDLGYSFELWTTRLLAQHIREHCESVGHPSLAQLARGTVSKILTANDIHPHKIRYYLERRDPCPNRGDSADPDFDVKMAQVLYVYKEVCRNSVSGRGGDVAQWSGERPAGDVRDCSGPLVR
jgi:transposase